MSCRVNPGWGVERSGGPVREHKWLTHIPGWVGKKRGQEETQPGRRAAWARREAASHYSKNPVLEKLKDPCWREAQRSAFGSFINRPNLSSLCGPTCASSALCHLLFSSAYKHTQVSPIIKKKTTITTNFPSRTTSGMEAKLILQKVLKQTQMQRRHFKSLCRGGGKENRLLNKWCWHSWVHMGGK